MIIALKLLIWIAFIAGFVYYQWYLIEKKKQRPFYLFDFFVIKGPAFIAYGIWVWDTQNDLRTLNILLWCVTSFWILMDLGLNVSRGKSPFYVGKQSGWLDRYGSRWPWAYWALKLLAAYILIQTTINFYTKFS